MRVSRFRVQSKRNVQILDKYFSNLVSDPLTEAGPLKKSTFKGYGNRPLLLCVYAWICGTYIEAKG